MECACYFDFCRLCLLCTQEISVFIVSYDGKIKEVYHHHGYDGPKDRSDKRNEQASNQEIDGPKPPRLLKECLISSHDESLRWVVAWAMSCGA